LIHPFLIVGKMPGLKQLRGSGWEPRQLFKSEKVVLFTSSGYKSDSLIS
jgi:hypothetical protein